MGDFVVHRARFFDYQPKAIQSMSYDEGLRKLAISRSDNTIEIWCTRNEFLESTIVPTADRQVEVILWCRSQLLSAGLDGFIVLYDLARLTAKKLVPSIGGAIWCMTRNKSETKIVVGTEDGYVVLFDIQIDGILFEKSFNKQETRILSLAWHRDEEMIITGGIDNIRVWDVSSGQVLQRISLGRVDRNKETLVWCLAITSDFQIVSGDSRGKVSVWNAENGSLIKSFQTHSVDVLCLCVDESEKHIYCSGIDPCVVQLDYVSISETENYQSWTKSNVYYNHTHDVRSICIANQQLISAGVDTRIVFKNIKDKQSHSLIRRYNSMPQKPIVDTCGDFVLLQYETHLELWKLGSNSSDTDDQALDEKKNGDCLPILRSPKKYLHLKSKNECHIVCSSIGSTSNDNSSNIINNKNKKTKSDNGPYTIWVSYSDLNVIHIYRVEISSREVLEPSIKVNKIKSLPLACGNRPAVLIKFSSNNSNTSQNKNQPEELRLCYLTNKSIFQCLKLMNDEIGFALECSIQIIQQDLLMTDNRVYMMAIKDDHVATVDTDHNLTIWSLKTQQIVATVPRFDRLTSCLCFHPTKNVLLVCYANRRIVEYDFELQEYTEWSRKTMNSFPRQWLKLHTKLLNCFYDKSENDKIVMHDEQNLVVLDKREKMPDDLNARIFQQQLALQNNKNTSNETESNSKCALHISNKYRYIVYASQPRANELLILEVTPLSVSEKLPPSLKQKKFGT